MLHNVYLPSYLTPFLIGGFEYESVSQTSISGKLYIKNYHEAPSFQFTIKEARLSQSELQDFYGFFAARKGRVYSFKLVDPFDDFASMEDTIIAPSNSQYSGSNVADTKELRQELLIFKKYGQEESLYLKKIYPLDESSIKIFYEDAELDFKYNQDTGSATLFQDIVDYRNLIAQCQFYKRVRFATEKISYQTTQNGSYLLNDISICEVMDD